MSLIRKHGAVLQAWACLDLVAVGDDKEKRKGNWEGKERKGTKSHKSDIFHLFVGKPPVNRF